MPLLSTLFKRTVTAGARFRQALHSEALLQMPGTINAYSALLAEHAGFQAIYLSGAGVANASYGLPDLGITSLDNVLEDVRRITSATQLPLLVDADTGWGVAFNIRRTVREMIKAGAAGIHIEDQVQAKRCGHRPGKAIVSQEEMVNRIKVAAAAKTDPDFVIMARTDAVAVEGLEAGIDRAVACVDAGADMIFPEAITELEHYREFVSAVGVPVLANITEFGKTPLFTVDELTDAGVSIALYPLTAFRAMSKAALQSYEVIRSEGTQRDLIGDLQTREELYSHLNYHAYEEQMDQLIREEKLS